MAERRISIQAETSTGDELRGLIRTAIEEKTRMEAKGVIFEE